MKIIIESDSSKLTVLYEELRNTCKMYGFNIVFVDNDHKAVVPSFVKRIFNKLRFR